MISLLLLMLFLTFSLGYPIPWWLWAAAVLEIFAVAYYFASINYILKKMEEK